jgi:hypothetical protein
VLPTAAFQSMAGLTGAIRSDAQMEMVLDRCFALNRHGGAVKRYFPRWYVEPKSDGG